MPLSLGSFTVVDTETTDADPATCRVVEAGAAVFRGGYLSHDASQRVNPGVPMHPDAARITGICDAALVHAPMLATASIVKMFKDPRLVGYNSEAFDRPILERELPQLPQRPWLDVFVFVSWHLRHLPKRNLCAIAEHLKVLRGPRRPLASSGRATERRRSSSRRSRSSGSTLRTRRTTTLPPWSTCAWRWRGWRQASATCRSWAPRGPSSRRRFPSPRRKLRPPGWRQAGGPREGRALRPRQHQGQGPGP